MGNQQLMNPLVGDTQNGGDIPHAPSSIGEHYRSLPGLLYGRTIGLAGSLAGLARLLDGPADGLGQHWPRNQLDRVLVGLKPQRRGFSHAAQRLIDGLAPGVDPRFLL
jgi:hypothetical protein